MHTSPLLKIFSKYKADSIICPHPIFMQTPGGPNAHHVSAASFGSSSSLGLPKLSTECWFMVATKPPFHSFPSCLHFLTPFSRSCMLYTPIYTRVSRPLLKCHNAIGSMHGSPSEGPDRYIYIYIYMIERAIEMFLLMVFQEGDNNKLNYTPHTHPCVTALQVLSTPAGSRWSGIGPHNDSTFSETVQLVFRNKLYHSLFADKSAAWQAFILTYSRIKITLFE